MHVCMQATDLTLPTKEGSETQLFSLVLLYIINTGHQVTSLLFFLQVTYYTRGKVIGNGLSKISTAVHMKVTLPSAWWLRRKRLYGLAVGKVAWGLH